MILWRDASQVHIVSRKDLRCDVMGLRHIAIRKIYGGFYRFTFETILEHMAEYRVYVVELRKKVFSENARFRAANPQFNGALECVYVGMTSKTPKQRLEQHKTGYRNAKGHKLSSNIVQKYGTYLRPSLYNHIPPMKWRAQALAMEKKLALELRRKRYAVWFG